jgi:hypothetical protein
MKFLFARALKLILHDKRTAESGGLGPASLGNVSRVLFAILEAGDESRALGESRGSILRTPSFRVLQNMQVWNGFIELFVRRSAVNRRQIELNDIRDGFHLMNSRIRHRMAIEDERTLVEQVKFLFLQVLDAQIRYNGLNLLLCVTRWIIFFL